MLHLELSDMLEDIRVCCVCVRKAASVGFSSAEPPPKPEN